MSVNIPNTESYKDIFSTSAPVESSYASFYDDFDNPGGRYSNVRTGRSTLGSFQDKVTPLHAMEHITDAMMRLHRVIREVDDFLSVAYIDCTVSPDLEEAHHHVWSEVVNKATTEVGDEIIIGKEIAPNYVSYAEYLYAREHKCRGCRALVIEYDSYVSKTPISYYFTLKTIMEFMLHELNCMNELIQTLIGDEYEDETEQKVAKEFYYWAISAKQYTQQFAEEIAAIPPELPQSQVDIIDKVEATQFEAFFSLKVNSYESEIKKLLGLLKREMVDTCEMYYHNYLGPAMKSRSLIAYPLELKLLSSTLKTKAPDLASEVVIAASSINGNVASLMADLTQKRINTDNRIRSIKNLTREKRRYISYIRQLQIKSKTFSKNIFLNIEEDEYQSYFEQVIIDDEKNKTFNSSHGYFNDLLEDHHPQYLKRSGGVITGNIEVKGTATVAGLDLAEHSHNGIDGSNAIRASSLDYLTDREESALGSDDFSENIEVKIDSYIPDILIGGRPVVDVTVGATINIDEVDPQRYSIQVSYLEIEE